jgi:Tfp pilus assembly protein PilX
MLVQTRPQPLARAAALPRPPAVLIVVASLLLATVSLLLPSAPTYDPWAWIIWGREITQLDLDTVDGPSWKPLPVIVTTLTAPLGEVSPYVWLVIGRAGALAGLPLAYLLAARLAGPVAGVAAAAGLALMPWWLRNGGLGNSEGLMASFVLAAVLAHLHGRRGWAFALALGAGLLRPEAWPFVGIYALWLLAEDRGRLRWVAGGLLTLPLLWLAPEYWGSGNAFRASDRAQDPNRDSPAFADEPAVEVVQNAIGMTPPAAVAGAVLALLAIVVAGRTVPREDRRTALWLAALAVAWVALVAAMTVRGFSGNERYLVVPAALLIVLGAAGVVWAARALLGSRLRRLSAAASVAAAVALAALFVAADVGKLGHTLSGIEYQADAYHDLGDAIEQAGGAARLNACGHAFAGAFFVPQVAWRLGVPIEQVDLEPEGRAVVFHVRTVAVAKRPSPRLAAGGPNVLAREGAWTITADCGAAR